MKINLLVAGRESGNAAKNIRHLLYVFVNRKLPEQYLPIDFASHEIKRSLANEEIELTILNCLGQERHPQILFRSFSRENANAFLLVCDDSDFESILYIRDKLYPLILAKNATAPIILVCISENITDLFSLTISAKELANKINAEYLECSANNINAIMFILDKVITTCVEQENNCSGNFDIDLLAKISLTNHLPRSSSSPEISSDSAPLVPPGNINSIPAMQTEEAQVHELSSASESSGEEYSPRMRH